MNKFNEDKKIKEIFNIKESVPDNINSIFDDFINKNVKEEKRNNIKVKKENIRHYGFAFKGKEVLIEGV